MKSVGPVQAYGHDYVASLDQDRLRFRNIYEAGVGVVRGSPLREKAILEMKARIREFGPVKPLENTGGSEGVEWTTQGGQYVSVNRIEGTLRFTWKPGSEPLLREVCRGKR